MRLIKNNMLLHAGVEVLWSPAC